jgi:hypothetical protein
MATAQEVAAHLTGYPRLVTWNDYRHVPHSPRPPFKAQTTTTYSFQYGSVQLTAGVYRLSSAQVTVQVLRGVNQSWVDDSWLNDPSITQADKDALLLHEQGHFDIIGAIARDFCRGLLDLELDEAIASMNRPRGAADTPQVRMTVARNYFRDEIHKLEREAQALRNRLENRFVAHQEIDGQYEQETNHGQVGAQQTIWNDVFFMARERDCSLPLSLILFNK